MRKAANRLQLDLAKDDWISIIRSLRVFYGLHHLIRPEVVATLLAVAEQQTEKENLPVQVIYH